MKSMRFLSIVMPGLDLGIHVDRQAEPGGDESRVPHDRDPL